MNSIENPIGLSMLPVNVKPLTHAVLDVNASLYAWVGGSPEMQPSGILMVNVSWVHVRFHVFSLFLNSSGVSGVVWVESG